MDVDSAYRRLAIAILELDVATLAAKLASQSECFDDRDTPSLRLAPRPSANTTTTPAASAQSSPISNSDQNARNRRITSVTHHSSSARHASKPRLRAVLEAATPG